MERIKAFGKQNKDLLLVLLCSVIYLGWFAFLEHSVTNNYHIIHVALDDYIPFCEYFIIPYLMWFLYVLLVWAWFYRNDREIFRKLSVFIFAGMYLSLLFCTIYPNGTDFRPVINPDKNIFCRIVAVLYGTDTPTNVLPSIHVFNSIGIHIAVLQSRKLNEKRQAVWIRRASLILCVSICLSTMFLKQHSLVDVLVASVLAYVMYGAVYEPAAAEEGARVSRRKLILQHQEDRGPNF